MAFADMNETAGDLVASRKVAQALAGAALAPGIVDRVIRAILEHRLPPGTKLTESALCEAFAAGRATVRRALLMLAERGTVTLEPNRGAFVASPTPGEAREVFAARRAIEPNVAADAARLISPGELALLRAHLAEEESAQRWGPHHDAIRLSGQFHVVLADCAGNALLARFVGELVARASLIIGLFGSPPGTCCISDEHQALIGALEKRDAAEAARIMSAHLSHIESELDLGDRKPGEIDVRAVLGSSPGGVSPEGRRPAALNPTAPAGIGKLSLR
jgi:DNA-binding GntR family transcriptional regulator